MAAETDDFPLSPTELDLLGPVILPDFNVGTSILDSLDEDENCTPVLTNNNADPEASQSASPTATADDAIENTETEAEQVALAPYDHDENDDQDLLDAVEQIESQELTLPTVVADAPYDHNENTNQNLLGSAEPLLQTTKELALPTVVTAECKNRFPMINPDERENIIEEASSKATKRQTRYGINIFRQWLTERERDINFENLSVADLDTTLQAFYAEVRNSDGLLYSKSTYVGIRASINRHLRAPPHNKSFSLMNNPDFHKSNQVFVAMLKKLQREGLDRAKHHISISEGDLEKLRESEVFALDNPRGLQRKIWFDIMISFGRRGRENQRQFDTSTFINKKDDKGHEYIEFAKSETTKNHRGGAEDDSFEKNPRMYSTYKADCPVNTFKTYMSKRNPASEHFFQLARPNVKPNDEIWYTSRPLGEKMLNNMMKDISKLANLSQIYTNHCVRSTTINVLAHAGITDREIMKITGHRCEASLSSYHADSSEKQKRKYSALLHGLEDAPEVPDVPRKVTQSNLNASIASASATSTTATGHDTPSTSCTTQYQLTHLNMLQNNVNNLPPLYSKQFEINNSSVHIYNYQLPHTG